MSFLANVQWRRLKKYTSRSGFFLCFLRCCRERYIPIRLLKWWHIGDITAEDNIYAASWFPSQTWPARQRGREDGDVEISWSAFFYVPVRTSRLTLNSPRNVTDRRRCGNSADDTLTKNRTYHNGMRGARAIVETLRQFFDVQSNPVPLSRFRLCALRRNCVPRETLIVIVYVSGRVTRDNRFHDYALPRCKPTDACATSWLDALWWALLNRIMGQSFRINEIIKSRWNWNF